MALSRSREGGTPQEKLFSNDTVFFPYLCKTIRAWLSKVADQSEILTYIATDVMLKGGLQALYNILKNNRNNSGDDPVGNRFTREHLAEELDASPDDVLLEVIISWWVMRGEIKEESLGKTRFYYFLSRSPTGQLREH